MTPLLQGSVIGRNEGKLGKVSFIFSCFLSLLSAYWKVKERKSFGPYIVDSFKFHMHSAVQLEKASILLVLWGSQHNLISKIIVGDI